MELKYAPQMVRTINYLRRLSLGKGSWEEGTNHVGRAVQNRALLINHFITGINPLVKSPQSDLDKEQFRLAVEEMGSILERAGHMLEEKDQEGLRTVVKALDENAVRMAIVVRELKKAQEETFKASSVRLINDIILIGMEVIRGKQPPDLLAMRLPPLRGYIMYVEATITTLKKRYPGEVELISFFNTQLERLRQAAGGLFIYLDAKEEARKADLSNVISLLDRAGMDLWAAFSALNQLFIADSKYSGDPSVQEFQHQLQSFKTGGIDKDRMKSALQILVSHQQAAALDVAMLENFVFLKPSEKEMFIPALVALLEKRDLLIAYIGENYDKPEKVEEALDKYNLLTKDFSDRLTELDRVFEQRPALEGAAHFREMLELIRLTYEEKISDIQLENKAIFIDEYSADFLRQLTLQERHNPETAQYAEALKKNVETQKAGISGVFAYLESGDRSLLPDAYVKIEQATDEMLKNREGIIAEGEKQADSTDANVCPYCSMKNPVTEITCSRCGRELFGGGYGGGLLDMTESAGASTGISQDLSENFRFIRQVVEDASQGVISFAEAEEMLMPHWERLQDTEAQLAENVLPGVEEAGDEELNRCYDEFYDILTYLIQIMQEIFGAIQQQDHSALQQRISPVEEAGLELFRLKQEMDQLSEGAGVKP